MLTINIIIFLAKHVLNILSEVRLLRFRLNIFMRSFERADEQKTCTGNRIRCKYAL